MARNPQPGQQIPVGAVSVGLQTGAGQRRRGARCGAGLRIACCAHAAKGAVGEGARLVGLRHLSEIVQGVVPMLRVIAGGIGRTDEASRPAGGKGYSPSVPLYPLYLG
jgi:hypothetical protein